MQGTPVAPIRPLETAGRQFFLLVYGLTIAGIAFVFSASFAVASRHGGDAYYYLKHQSLFALAGLVIMLLISYFKPRWLEKLAFPALLVTCILMFIAAIWGKEIRGARCWIWGFQPSEFAKVAFVLYMAALFARSSRPVHHHDYERRSRVLVKAVLATLTVSGLLVLQSDQGMALLVVSMAFVMFYLGGMPRHLLALGFLAAGGIGALLVRYKSYIWIRILACIHPDQYVHGPGYHIYSMLIALSKGYILGQGMGFSDDKWRTLPEPHNDSIFCVVGGELGVWGSLALLAAMTLLSVLSFRIARRSSSSMGWYAAAGCGMLLTLQALINIAAATNSMPVTGINLPFISAGGSSLVSSMIAAGVVLAVSRYSLQTQRIT